MIIYGWGYFNRRDHSVVRGHCQSCGKQGYLRSYTSSRFFTLYFIPVIPIGKQKILEECPLCKAARGLGYGKYRKLIKTELAAAIAAYESNPTGEEAATKAISAAAFCQDRIALQRIGPNISAAFPRNERVLAQLAAAGSYLCLEDLAAASYLEALKLSNDEELSKAAENHMRLSAVPKPRPPNRYLQSVPVLIVPAAVLVFLISIIADPSFDNHSDAFLVNGLDTEYSVVINGQTYTLRPHEHRRVSAIGGKSVAIEPIPGDLEIPASTFDISKVKFAEGSRSPTTVINPDQAAVFAYERTYYSDRETNDESYDFRAHTGQPAYRFGNVDYVFRAFPEQISVSKSSHGVFKTRISDITTESPQDLIGMLYNSGEVDDLSTYLENALRYPTQDETLIQTAARFLSSESFLQLAEARIHDRPVNIEWHRAYQFVLENSGQEVEQRYRTMYQDSPDNPAIAYLLARVLTNPTESKSLLQKAAAMSTPTGYAENALAYHCILDGDFDEACANAKRAIEIQRNSDGFDRIYRETLFAAKRYDEILKRANKQLSADRNNFAALADKIACLAKLNKIADADREIENLAKALDRDRDYTPEQRIQIVNAFKRSLSLSMGDKKGFLNAIGNSDDARHAFYRSLSLGELDTCCSLAQSNADDLGIEDRMTLFILLSRSKSDAAKAVKQEIVDTLDSGTADQQKWSKWIRGTETVAPEVAIHTSSELSGHWLYLATLHQSNPQAYADLGKHAKRIQYMDTESSFVLKEVLSSF